MTRAWCVAVVLTLLLTGCQVDNAAADPVDGPVNAGLNQDFTLGGGQEASIDGEGLRVRFTDVGEDSRCPARVECFWTGQARLAILVQPDAHAPSTLEFNTNPVPGQKVSTVRVDEYTIAMRSLEPYPQTPDDATSLEDYRVTLSVSKG